MARRKTGVVNDAQWRGGAGKRQETSRQAPLSSFCLSKSMLYRSNFPLNTGVRPRKESKGIGRRDEGRPEASPRRGSEGGRGDRGFSPGLRKDRRRASGFPAGKGRLRIFGAVEAP